MHTYVIKTPLY